MTEETVNEISEKPEEAVTKEVKSNPKIDELISIVEKLADEVSRLDAGNFSNKTGIVGIKEALYKLRNS